MAKINRVAPESSCDPRWRDIAWSDVDAWAGTASASRGAEYQQQRRVKQLSVSADGRVHATVLGGERYAVTVGFVGRGRALFSQCTCPVGHANCKHAVATIAEYLARLAAGKTTPVKPADENAAADAPRRGKSRVSKTTDLDREVGSMTKEQLAELVRSLVRKFPEVKKFVGEGVAVRAGDAERLYKEARKEMRRVTARRAWHDGWSYGGESPDYRELQRQLEQLESMGHADALVRLAGELIERGMKQVSESDDEGETATDLSACLDVVFSALPRSSLAPKDKLMFVIDARLADEFDLMPESALGVLEAESSQTAWSDVADVLAERLSRGPSADGAGHGSFRVRYDRDTLTTWLAHALARGGRDAEVLPLYRVEARRTHSYMRLVDALLASEAHEEARQWAIEGVAATRGVSPGVSRDLIATLRTIAEREGAWDVVAAHDAQRFFEVPTVQSFSALVASADKARCRDNVRTAALQFLRSGVTPAWLGAKPAKRATIATELRWPLPWPDYLRPAFREPARGEERPRFDVLIDIAIADDRPDDVVHWYEKHRALRESSRTATVGYAPFGESGLGDRVANAVAATHPDVAIDIYLRQVERALPVADKSNYQIVADGLTKLKPVLDSVGRGGEWTELVLRIRDRYRNRPKLLEALDVVGGRPAPRRR